MWLDLTTSFLSLPTSLILLLSTSAWTASASASASAAESNLEWPYNLPPGMPYYPEDAVYVKRALAAQKHLQSRLPVGMQKMRDDPNDMFFLDYWQFEPSPETGDDQRLRRRSTPPTLHTNDSESAGLLPPLRLHSLPTFRDPQDVLLFFRRNNLVSRDFQCPTGTSDCSSLGSDYKYSCCETGETCIKVDDTGSGDVGCCPAGSVCGTQIGSCDTSAGYTSCPGSSNGGCCIPNFSCLDVGCISVTTSTTTTTLAVATVQTCDPGFRSCAASFGGGCCSSSQTCGTSTCIGASTSSETTSTPTTTSSGSASIPVRPTGPSSSGDDGSAVTASILTTGTSRYAVCPTNFYFCSAYFRPGCCRIGRDCAMTDCPAATSSSTIVSNGVTVVVPVGGSTGGSGYEQTALITGTATFTSYGSGACMVGWVSCSASIGGGCCPGGFGCGASCTADNGAGTSVVPKIAPNGVGSRYAGYFGWSFMAFGLVAGLGMVLL